MRTYFIPTVTNKSKRAAEFFRKALVMGTLCFLPLASGHSQTVKEVSLDVPRIVPVSPEASMMEKYQSYPVDHCTGVPDITIPLYEIDLGELTIPVTLSYHASGMKPKEQSGVAGTGWTLNLEPSVSRQINGKADDDEYGWFDRYREWNDLPTNPDERAEYYASKADNGYDTYPDKFTYRLPHGGGGGYFKWSSEPLWTSPRTNDRVEYHNASGMEITDENGIRYLFNGTVEKSGKFVTRWMCSGIQSARHGGELAHFSYRTRKSSIHPNLYYNLDNRLVFATKERWGDNRTMMFDEYGSRYYQLFPNGEYGATEPRYEASSKEECGLSYAPSPHYVQGDLSYAYLTQVSFGGNRIEVSYKPIGDNTMRSEALDEITVTDSKGTEVRRIRFHVTQYNSGTSLTKLDSVVISAPGAEKKAYRFRYYNESSVPSTYTTAVDHWGFCNGAYRGGDRTIPSLRHDVRIDRNGFSDYETYTVNYEGADREPHAQWAQTGVLSMITDPQGVQTRFSYEGNSAAFRDNSKAGDSRDYLHPVGGLRVRTIEAYDPDTRKRLQTTYTYGLTDLYEKDYEPVWGGGAIKHIVTQRDYYSSLLLVDGDPSTNETWTEELEFYASMPVTNITFGNGSPVMYNVVRESVWGDDGRSNQESHETVYYYHVKTHRFEDLLEWDDYDQEASVRDFLMNSITEENEGLVRREPYQNHEPSDDFTYGASHRMYGALLRTDYYRNDELVMSRENEYLEKEFWGWDYTFDVPERRVATLTDLYELEIGGNRPAFEVYTYIPDLTTFRMLDKTIEKRYLRTGDRVDTLTTEKKYDYKYDYTDPLFSLRPRRVETLRSDGTAATDEYDYLENYPSVLSFHRHAEDGDSVAARILFMENSPLPLKVQSRTSGTGDYRDEVSYTEYDGNGNPAEIYGKDGTPVCFLWGYHNRYPIARVANASIEEVYAAMAGFRPEEMAERDEPDEAEWAKLHALREKLPDAEVTVYRYHPLHGVASVTDPNGVTTEFGYDGYSRLTESSFIDEDTHKVMLQKYVYKF